MLKQWVMNKIMTYVSDGTIEMQVGETVDHIIRNKSLHYFSNDNLESYIEQHTALEIKRLERSMAALEKEMMNHVNDRADVVAMRQDVEKCREVLEAFSSMATLVKLAQEESKDD